MITSAFRKQFKVDLAQTPIAIDCYREMSSQTRVRAENIMDSVQTYFTDKTFIAKL